MWGSLEAPGTEFLTRSPVHTGDLDAEMGSSAARVRCLVIINVLPEHPQTESGEEELLSYLRKGMALDTFSDESAYISMCHFVLKAMKLSL